MVANGCLATRNSLFNFRKFYFKSILFFDSKLKLIELTNIDKLSIHFKSTLSSIGGARGGLGAVAPTVEHVIPHWIVKDCFFCDFGITSTLKTVLSPPVTRVSPLSKNPWSHHCFPAQIAGTQFPYQMLI